MMERLSAADCNLAAKIEAAEAANALHLVRSALPTEHDFAFEHIAGGTAIFAGMNSPMSRAIAVGMNGPVTAEQFERLEEFFFIRGCSCSLELCPLADPNVLSFVQARQYRYLDSIAVLARPLSTVPESNSLDALRVGPEDVNSWARVISQAITPPPNWNDSMAGALAAMCGDAQCWSISDAAGAAMRVEGDIAFLFADATRPVLRRQGLQSRLIEARVAAAASQGCRLAVSSVTSGSASHRNYERLGFQLLYFRNMISARGAL